MRPKTNYSKFQANFEEEVFVEDFFFGKDATMINPLIHGGKKRSHTLEESCS